MSESTGLARVRYLLSLCALSKRTLSASKPNGRQALRAGQNTRAAHRIRSPTVPSFLFILSSFFAFASRAQEKNF